MRTLLLSLFILMTASSLVAASKLINIDYFFKGYDIFSGNPTSSIKDSGLREYSIFDPKYEDGRFTEDWFYEVPDHIDVGKGGYTEHQFFIARNMDDYLDILKATLSATDGLPQAAFRASAEYKQAEEEIRNRNHQYMYIRSSYIVYEASINTNRLPALSYSFKGDLRGLISMGYDESAYMSFLNKYGTHFIQKAEIGGTIFYEIIMTEEGYKWLQDGGFDVTFIDVVYSYPLRDDAPDYTDRRNEWNTHFISAKPVHIGLTNTNNYYTLEEIMVNKDLIVPISSTIEPIYKLLEYVSSDEGFTSDELSTLRANLQTAYNNYCPYLMRSGKLNNCGGSFYLYEQGFLQA